MGAHWGYTTWTAYWNYTNGLGLFEWTGAIPMDWSYTNGLPTWAMAMDWANPMNWKWDDTNGCRLGYSNGLPTKANMGLVL